MFIWTEEIEKLYRKRNQAQLIYHLNKIYQKKIINFIIKGAAHDMYEKSDVDIVFMPNESTDLNNINQAIINLWR